VDSAGQDHGTRGRPHLDLVFTGQILYMTVCMVNLHVALVSRKGIPRVSRGSVYPVVPDTERKTQFKFFVNFVVNIWIISESIFISLNDRWL
jgi:hypothetical protein